jgi:hypothetical protein
MPVRIEAGPTIERFGVSDIYDSRRADMIVVPMRKVNDFISFLLIIPLETKGTWAATPAVDCAGTADELSSVGLERRAIHRTTGYHAALAS